MVRKGFRRIFIPLKTYSSMEVGTASEPVQEFDAVTGQYFPDRSLINCELVLTPLVGYIDPNSGAENPNAAAMLTDGHWYRIDNTSGGVLDSTTEIVSGTSYVIDSLAGSATYGRIRIKQNVPPGNPVTYVFRATLLHPNGDVVPVEIRHQARTRSVATIPVLSLDNATEQLYNPLSSEDVITFHPVLTPAMPGATYAWESLHGTAWGPLAASLLDWAVEPDGNGVKVRRSVMPDRIDLRCTVTIPTAVGTPISDVVTVAIVRRIPEYETDISQLVNVRDNVRSIAPKAVIRMGDRVLADPKSELAVIWYNAADKEVARGMNPVIQLSDLGGVLDVGLDVADAGGWRALVDDKGNFIVTDTGALIIVKKPV